jgi:dTDP-4-dehydrorhamnose reductase
VTGRLLVLGGNGMLGHKVAQTAVAHLGADAVYATVRVQQPGLAALIGITPDQLLYADVTAGLDSLLDQVRPGVIVNCTGVLPTASGMVDPANAIAVNALAPHRMAASAQTRGMRLIHVSTDAVFSGTRGHYTEDDAPDATDLYGRSKALGEVADQGQLSIRTSLVGRQLRGSRGLLEWFLSQRGQSVQGYRKTRFSGLSTPALSRIIVELITNHPALSGRLHVGGDAISKYDLLHLMNETFNAGITIVPADGPGIDRSLDSGRFAAVAGAAPSWADMLDELAKDETPYDEWRQRAP